MSAEPYILIVEDEQKLARLLQDYLLASGYQCRILNRGDGVVAAVRAELPSIILLDLSLPGYDGLSICRDIRQFSEVPIIMITARVEEVDRLLGLEIGADDYVCKPFSLREVVARVKALLRRVSSANSETPDASPLHFDEDRFEARYRGNLLVLTPVEYRLLRALGARPGQVLSRNQLMNSLYADHRIVSDRTVDSHVKNLRRKLCETVPGTDPLRSVYGVGYKLDWYANAE